MTDANSYCFHAADTVRIRIDDANTIDHAIVPDPWSGAPNAPVRSWYGRVTIPASFNTIAHGRLLFTLLRRADNYRGGRKSRSARRRLQRMGVVFG